MLRLVRLAHDVGCRHGAPPQDAAERAKQARFLLARGFDGETVRRVLAWDDADDAAD